LNYLARARLDSWRRGTCFQAAKALEPSVFPNGSHLFGEGRPRPQLRGMRRALAWGGCHAHYHEWQSTTPCDAPALVIAQLSPGAACRRIPKQRSKRMVRPLFKDRCAERPFELPRLAFRDVHFTPPAIHRPKMFGREMSRPAVLPALAYTFRPQFRSDRGVEQGPRSPAGDQETLRAPHTSEDSGASLTRLRVLGCRGPACRHRSIPTRWPERGGDLFPRGRWSRPFLMQSALKKLAIIAQSSP